MAKKTLKKKVLKKTAPAKQSANKIAGPVADSAREIWLAGLGAFHFAQAESGKVIEQGNKLFEKLVAEGKKLDKKTRGVAGSAVDGLRDDVESKVGKVRRQAVDNWDKLEDIFENRVARVMGQLGVPTSDEISTLTKRVETLSAQVAKLAGTKAPAAKKAAPKKAKAAPKNAAAKKAKAAPKKAAPKKATPKKAKAAPKKAAAKKAAPKKTTPKKAAPKKASPKQTTTKTPDSVKSTSGSAASEKATTDTAEAKK